MFPDIRYVVPPSRMDGTPTGEAPRMRHDPDCGHFKWPDGTMLGVPKLATEEQMRSLPACKSCIERLGSSETSRSAHSGRYGEQCSSCGMTLPLTGVCDDCA